MIFGFSPYQRDEAYDINILLCSETPGTGYTAHMRVPAFILVTHFAAKIMLIAFYNQWCDMALLFVYYFTTNIAKTVWAVYALFGHYEGEWNMWTS